MKKCLISQETRMADDEKLVHVNSSYKTQGTNTNFFISFNNALHLQNAMYVRIKSITVPNMFANVYGTSTTLLYEELGSVKSIIVPEGNYSATSLADEITAVASASIPPLSLSVTFVDGRFNFTNGGTNFTLLGVTESKILLGVHRTLNEIIGSSQNSESPQLSYITPYPPALYGPTKIFIVSDRLGLGYSVHSNGSIHSKIASISLAGVPYGNIAHHEISERANNQVYFRDSRQTNTLDIELNDEYDQNVILPPNSHVDIEMIIGHNL